MKVLKWIGIVLGVVVLIACAGAAWVYLASSRVIHKVWVVQTAEVAVPTDSASIARGRHFVTAINKCVDCHGEDLAGGVVMSSGPFATIVAPNLTRAASGVGAAYTNADWERAIRHGVGRGNRGLAIMPAEAYQFLSDTDLSAVIAYVKQVPPVERTWPATRYGPISRLLLAQHKLPFFSAAAIDHSRRGLTYPAPDTTAEYGHYLANVGGCTSCHNPAMSGGPNPSLDPLSPPPANLTPGGKPAWTEQEFVRTLREGKTQDGRDIDSRFMPWRAAGHMTDAEIHAVFSWLRSLPAKELGQR